MARYIYCIFSASFCSILRLRTLFCRDLLNVMFDVPDTAWHGMRNDASIIKYKTNKTINNQFKYFFILSKLLPRKRRWTYGQYEVNKAAGN